MEDASICFISVLLVLVLYIWLVKMMRADFIIPAKICSTNENRWNGCITQLAEFIAPDCGTQVPSRLVGRNGLNTGGKNLSDFLVT